MSAERWTGIISRITRSEAEDIDDLAGTFDKRRNLTGQDIMPAGLPAATRDVKFKAADFVAIGVRVDKPRQDIADVALQLASLALERQTEVVILNHLDYSGFERFGFRSERVVGETPEARAACEAEIRRFWQIELVI